MSASFLSDFNNNRCLEFMLTQEILLHRHFMARYVLPCNKSFRFCFNLEILTIYICMLVMLCPLKLQELSGHPETLLVKASTESSLKIFMPKKFSNVYS